MRDRMMEAVRTDLPPGIATYQDLFQDTIHPDSVLIHGLSCLVVTYLYQTNLATDAPSLVLAPAGVTQAQSDYFKALAWQIVSGYEPAGMGGTEGAAQVWSGHDWFPHVTTPVELDAATTETAVSEPWFDWRAPAEDLPPMALSWTADGYAGPTLTGPQPTIADGLLHFDGEAETLRGPLPESGDRYGIMACRFGPAVGVQLPLVAHAPLTGNWWSGNDTEVMYGGGNYVVIGSSVNTSASGINIQDAPDWLIIEWAFEADGTETLWINNEAHVRTGGAPNTEAIHLFGRFDQAAGPDVTVAGLALVDRMPTPTERAALLAMVYARMPKGPEAVDPLLIEGQTFTEGQVFSGPEWDGLVIRNCVFENIAFPGERGQALLLNGVSNATIENNTITNIENGDGIRLGIAASSDGVTIQGNTITGIDGDGISIGQRQEDDVDNTGVRIEGNTISDTGRAMAGGLLHGIYVQSSDFEIIGNTITQSNDGNGISVRSWGVVSGNEIVQSGKSGIAYYADHMGAGRTLTIDDNAVSGSGYHDGRSDIDLIAVPVADNLVAAIGVTNNQLEFGPTGAAAGSGYSGITITNTGNTYLAGFPRVPDAPRNLRVTDRTADSISVAWDAPIHWGGAAITFRVAARPVGGTATTANTADLSRLYSGLPGATEFEIRVRATSAQGDGPWTDWLPAQTA